MGNSATKLIHEIGKSIATGESRKLKPKQVQALWKKYDVNSDGMLSMSELTTLVNDIRQELISLGHHDLPVRTDVVVAAILDQIDSNGDGEITFQEFQHNVDALFGVLDLDSAQREEELARERRLQDQARRKREELESFVRETNFDMDQVESLLLHFKSLASLEEDDDEIDKNEFFKCLGVEGGLFYERMFEVFDVDGSGCINVREFIQGLSVFCKSATVEEKIQFCFRIWDQDGDGCIEMPELKKILVSSLQDEHQHLPAALIDQLVQCSFEEADTDGNGKIDFQEFAAMARKHPMILESMTLQLPGASGAASSSS